MAYYQGLAMGGFDMSMGMAAAGPPPPNPPGSGYSNVPVSRPVINLDDTDDENAEGIEENQDIAVFVTAPATPTTPAAYTTPATLATPFIPATTASTAAPAVPAALNSGERKPPRQPCRAGTDDPENYTDIVPSQSSWSFENLPDILYVFRGPDRPRGNAGYANIPYKPSPWKNSPALRCFPILPDRISSNVEEFRVEAWMRMDRRIQLRDITDRMNPKFRIFANTLQQRGVRFRQAFSIASWGVSSKQTDAAIETIRVKLIEEGVDLSKNTTRGVTPGLKFPEQGEEGGRVPTPKQYAKRPDTTIRRGITTDNVIPRSIGPVPALVPVMQTVTPATTPDRKPTSSKVLNIPSLTAAATATTAATIAAYPVMPATSTSLGGLSTPIRSQTPTLSAQTLARNATDAIKNPQTHCYMAPVISESGEIRRVRAPDVDTANAMLARTIEGILQRQTRNPDFENALIRRSSVMKEYRRRFTPRPPQTFAEAEAYFRRTDAVLNQVRPITSLSLVADTAPTTIPTPQPLTISNPGHNLLRRVQYVPIEGSAPPRIEKATPHHNRRIHLLPRQNLRDSARKFDINLISQVNNIAHNNIVAQSTAETRTYSENFGSNDVEILDISDDEVFEQPPTSPTLKLEETDNDQYELDRLDPATVRSIVNSTEARTETEFLQLCDQVVNGTRNGAADESTPQPEVLTTEFNELRERALRMAAEELDDAMRVEGDIAEEIDATPSFDDLINIYEHEESEPELPSAQELHNAANPQVIDSIHDQQAAEMQRIASQPLHEFFGMTIERFDRFLAGYPDVDWEE